MTVQLVPTKAGNTDTALRRNGCLAALSPETLAHLKPYLKRQDVLEGTILWDPEQPSSDVYFPATGVIAIGVPLREGSNVESASVGPEGAAGAFLEAENEQALTRGVVQIGGDFYRISAAHLSGLPNREILALQTFCKDWILLQAQQRAACNAVHTAEQRLARWLLQNLERANGTELRATQELIADALGIRRTTVTLIAQSFQAKGHIQYRRGTISAPDPQRLAKLSCECHAGLSKGHWLSQRLASFSGRGPAHRREA